MTPEYIEHSASEARSNFEFLFEGIAQLYNFHYTMVPSTKLEDMKKVVQEMKDDEKISEYLSDNLEQALKLYPTVFSGVVAEAYRADPAKERDHLQKVNAFLTILIDDLCGEINEITKEVEEYKKKSLIRWLDHQ